MIKRNRERVTALIARLIEPDCVNSEWRTLYDELKSFVGPLGLTADRMLREASKKRAAEVDKPKDADRSAAALAKALRKATTKSAKPLLCKTGRRQKTGCEEQDAPLIEEMRHMLVKRKANSLHAAARMVASDGSKVAGVCDLESKVLRLVDGYWEKYGDTDP
jgi:hypothetical protein